MANSRKRRHSSDQHIRRKIKKLEEKLKKRRRIIESSDSETETAITENTAISTTQPHDDSPPRVVSPPPMLTELTAPGTSSSEPTLPVEDPVNDSRDLDPEILELLGDAPQTEVVLGPAVHKDIGTRWQDILLKGLKKETKEQLVKQYLVPSNCDLLTAPELNPEAKAALPDDLTKRDLSLFSKQKQLGTALAALAIAMDRVIREDTKQNILKPLSDACRLLCDNHFRDTTTRRFLVLRSVNSSVKDTLLKTERNKYLFGENVTEKLKTAKVIQKSGNDLKIPTPKSKFNKNNFVKSNTLNSQHRKTQLRGETRAFRGGYGQQHPARTSTRQQQQNRAGPPPRRAHSPPPPPRRMPTTRR